MKIFALRHPWEYYSSSYRHVLQEANSGPFPVDKIKPGPTLSDLLLAVTILLSKFGFMTSHCLYIGCKCSQENKGGSVN